VRRYQQLRLEQAGFTLVELLAVIAIVGILTAIAVPLFLAQRGHAYGAQAQNDLHSLASAEEAYVADYGTYSGNISPAGLGVEDFVQTNGVKMGVAFNGSGYCAAALTAAGAYYWYDSLAGGLQHSWTNTLTPPATASGACAAVRPASVS
jgi:prepilin-type N-terminal cleavage/methylation domain-containing protein